MLKKKPSSAKMICSQLLNQPLTYYLWIMDNVRELLLSTSAYLSTIYTYALLLFIFIALDRQIRQK